MTRRARIWAALDHRAPDWLPIDFGGTDCASTWMLAQSVPPENILAAYGPARDYADA